MRSSMLELRAGFRRSAVMSPPHCRTCGPSHVDCLDRLLLSVADHSSALGCGGAILASGA